MKFTPPPWSITLEVEGVMIGECKYVEWERLAHAWVANACVTLPDVDGMPGHAVFQAEAVGPTQPGASDIYHLRYGCWVEWQGIPSRQMTEGRRDLNAVLTYRASRARTAVS